jgi:hypothetical protein
MTSEYEVRKEASVTLFLHIIVSEGFCTASTYRRGLTALN